MARRIKLENYRGYNIKLHYDLLDTKLGFIRVEQDGYTYFQRNIPRPEKKTMFGCRLKCDDEITLLEFWHLVEEAVNKVKTDIDNFIPARREMNAQKAAREGWVTMFRDWETEVQENTLFRDWETDAERRAREVQEKRKRATRKIFRTKVIEHEKDENVKRVYTLEICIETYHTIDEILSMDGVITICGKRYEPLEKYFDEKGVERINVSTTTFSAGSPSENYCKAKKLVDELRQDGWTLIGTKTIKGC